MRVLFIGDVVGSPGRKTVRKLLPGLVAKYGAGLVIANGENIAAGFGVSEATALELFEAGVEVVTTGNHVWDRKEALPYLNKEYRIIRPANYPAGAPGFGSILYPIKGGGKVAILNLSGRVFMPALDCPFALAGREAGRLKEETGIIIVDFHAEATSEKMAMGYFLEGRVSAVVGTHTHVQTADERVLPGGTAYITDVGMTGPMDSIIGVGKKEVIEKFLTAMPRRFEVPKGPCILSAVVIDIDDSSGRALSIERIMVQSD